MSASLVYHLPRQVQQMLTQLAHEPVRHRSFTDLWTLHDLLQIKIH